MKLDSYFERVGFAGAPAPTLANLRTLHALHAAAIPFENLSPLLGEPVSLDVGALQEKLVARRRGGWCFEHNLLFMHVLRAMGYSLRPLAARVRWNVPPNAATPRSHCLSLVELPEGPHIADVGFGGLTLTAPLALRPGEVQETPHEAHRIVAEGDGFGLEARVGGDWQRLYNFDLAEALQADYEVSNWYLGNFPQSQFVTGLICARAAPDMRHALRNTRYSVHHPGGLTERRFIARLDDMKGVLRDAMKIPLPDSARLDAALQRVLDAHPPT